MRKITNYLGRERVCLIMTNQLREKLGVSFGDKYTTSGGKAIGFHSSVRIRLKSIGQIKMKKGMVEQVIGIKTNATVIKNRMGPPLRSIEYDIYFDSGIDDYGSWLSILKEQKLVTQAGAWYTYQVVDPDTGEVEDIKFQSKDFYEKVLSNQALKDSVYEQICDRLILKYKMNVDTGIDDVFIEEDFVGEDE
jgi:recombination protein RecA